MSRWRCSSEQIGCASFQHYSGELASRGSLGIDPLGESETARRARYGTDGPAPAPRRGDGARRVSVRVTLRGAPGSSGATGTNLCSGGF